MSNEVSTIIDTVNLSTIDKKGNRVSFERSIGKGTLTARQGLQRKVYGLQVENGIYGPIIRDALAAGVVPKANRDMLDFRLASMGRNTSKANCVDLASMMLSVWAVKVPKGEKAFYVDLLRQLVVSLGEAPVQGEVVGEVSGAPVVS
jgi:hypothetical protein